MSYNVRHQVFVSSTFTDLIEERAEVIQAIWELDCIPTGMEAFVASNESQWDVIRKVIDECDYYVLILGGRYGSVLNDGESYTEKEYRYAKRVGLPILAFVHANPEEIPAGKSEKIEDSQIKLDAFRNEIMQNYPIKSWSSPSELGGHVSRSLIREIKVNPRPGWIRNDGSSPVSLLERINSLTEENRNLREKVSQDLQANPDPNLENGDDKTEIFGTRRLWKSGVGAYTAEWYILISWNNILKDIGPALINETSEDNIKAILSQLHLFDELNEDETLRGNEKISNDSFNAVIIQFRALGFIEQGVKKRGVNDQSSYWRITPLGDRQLVNLLARRKFSTTADSVRD